MSVYLLLGYPGTGKYTVARALAEELADRGTQARVVDNHYINNPVFGVMHTDGIRPLPPRVWELAGQVRDAVLTTIEELAPPDWSFVFTNYIRAAEVSEGSTVTAYLKRLERLAAARGTGLRCVALTCRRDEALRRVPAADRRQRLKTISADWVAQQHDEHPPFEPRAALALDVTALAPHEAARRILDHPWEGA